MTLKAVVDTLDGVPEAARGFYTEKDGKHVLTVEGMVPKDRLDEFRDNNLALKRERDDILARYKDIDPDAARSALDLARKQQEKKLLDAGKVDELVAERVGSMKSEFQKQIDALAKERDGAKKHLESLVLDGGLRDAAAKAGVRPTAIDDVLLRGRAVFQMVDGKAVPMDGDKPVYGKSGDPMDISEWVGGLADRAPHLFEPSSGGGSRQGSGAPSVGAGRVSRDDTSAFLANIEAIAKGKTKVV